MTYSNWIRKGRGWGLALSLSLELAVPGVVLADPPQDSGPENLEGLTEMSEVDDIAVREPESAEPEPSPASQVEAPPPMLMAPANAQPWPSDTPPPEPRRPFGSGMVVGGFVGLAGAQTITLATYAGIGATPEVWRPLLIPVAGPFIAAGNVRAELIDDGTLIGGLADGVAEMGAAAQRGGLVASGIIQTGLMVVGVVGLVLVSKTSKEPSKGPRLSSGPGGLRLDF
jgi:hypothetical protein